MSLRVIAEYGGLGRGWVGRAWAASLGWLAGSGLLAWLKLAGWLGLAGLGWLGLGLTGLGWPASQQARCPEYGGSGVECGTTRS